MDFDVEGAQRLLVTRGVGREVADRRDARRGDFKRSGVSEHDRLSARLRAGEPVPEQVDPSGWGVIQTDGEVGRFEAHADSAPVPAAFALGVVYGGRGLRWGWG